MPDARVRRTARASDGGRGGARRPDRGSARSPCATWTDVFAAILAEVDRRGPDGAWLYGWDPLLQRGLPEPTLDWLDGLAPHHPLVIMHNSGHQAFFNTAAARSLGLDRDTPDPVGARYGRDDLAATSTAPRTRPPPSGARSPRARPPTSRRP
ncbi:amidohydrolase family protein [Yinghuangia aomiensis]